MTATAEHARPGVALRSKIAIIVAIVAAVLVVDLASKEWAQRTLPGLDTKHYLGGLLRIGYVENTGVFLSLGHALSPAVRFWLFVVGVAAVLATLLVLTLVDHRFHLPEVIAVAAIVGGGVGNLVDRIQLDGSVRDFLNVGIGQLRTGIFNVADMAITFGGIALLLFPLFRRKVS
ncbi:MAG TPA: signal peptidase II [Candidatus Polarisedimenticolaceae bacterium]|nr:signal peptidase II [Candidatus Polarisedimenticolaceae bacterium]